MSTFQFKYFSIQQTNTAMKVGTDAMLLGSLSQFKQQGKLLDIGTGTGVLSLMLAQRFRALTITALELDEAACTDARYNFSQPGFQTQFELFTTDAATFRSSEKFDGIISNPPFFEGSSKSENELRNQARHTDSLSTQQLLVTVQQNLAPEGQFWVIIPSDKQSGFIEPARKTGLYLQNKILVEGKPGKVVRSILAFGFEENAVVQSDTFIIRDDSGRYTDEYIQLTKEFHNADLSKES